MNTRRLWLGCVLVLGCNDDDIDLETSGDSQASATLSGADSNDGGSSSDGGGTTAPATDGDTAAAEESSTGDVEDSCSLSRPCEVGFCVAPYADNHRGAFECIDVCVEAEDPFVWCFDDGACCDPEATCTARGYCVGPDDPSSSSDEGSTGAGDSTGDSTG